MSVKKFQLDESIPYEFGADAKAHEDASAIARALGFDSVTVMRHGSNGAMSMLWSRVRWVLQSVSAIARMPREAIVFVQFPLHFLRSRLGVVFLEWMKRLRRVRFVTLVHDINRLRDFASCSEDATFDRLVSLSSVVIVHSAAMRTWLESRGMAKGNTVELEVFDYLSERRPEPTESGDFRRITLAGNLGLNGKSGFIRHLKEISDVEWELYGAGFDEDRDAAPNVHYHGCFAPDEVTRHLVRGFGLVWDGDSLDTCSGGWGEYLRYDAPRKTSMYIAAGLPVVVWSKAAQAEFVERGKIGFSVSSLRELGERLRNMTQSEYEAFQANAHREAERLRKGGSLRQRLIEAERRLSGCKATRVDET